MNKILLVDDDRELTSLLKELLDMEGFNVLVAHDGEQALALLDDSVDLLLLDVMMPKKNGIDTLKELRQTHQTPVIMLTARGSELDRVLGLELGADDYLVKPFDVVELVARVEAVLRRYNKTERLLTAGDVTVDVEARRVTRAGRNVELTNKEFGLLVLFIQNKNVALFRETLYEKVWEGEYSGDSRTLDLHVQRLRRKLGWENNLVAVYKVGYRLEVVQ